MRRHHPDVSPAADAAAATARLTTAYRLLRAHRNRLPLPALDSGLHPDPGPGAVSRDVRAAARRAEATPEATPVRTAGEDSVLVVGPKDDVYWALHQACDTIGDVTYADPEGGLIEARVPAPDGSSGADASTLLITLQGRANGTEAFFTLESPDAARAPSLPNLVDRIARILDPG